MQAQHHRERRSIRVFKDMPVPEAILKEIFEAARIAPQSCNRQTMKLVVIADRPLCSQIGGLLAGGTGWLSDAPVVVLVFADLSAYKSPVEISFMPWLDAGVLLAAMTYAAAASGLGSCIVNPHMRPKDELEFKQKFNPHGRLFCGALALGYAACSPDMPEKKPIEELVEWM